MSNRRQSRTERFPFGRSGAIGGNRAIAVAALLLASLLAAPLPGQELRTTAVAELNFTAGAGQVFELQGSQDLTAWRNFGDVIFGEGESVSEFVATAEPASAYPFYRVKISPSKEFGFAPQSLYGKQIEFNDEGDALVYSFHSRATGSAGGEDFAYHYRKLGDTLARLDIERGDGWSQHIELDFSADLVGRYTCGRHLDGRVTDIDAGTFTFHQSPPGSDGQPGDTIPISLRGHTYLFSDGDTDERFDFVTTDSGRRVDRAEITHFSYGYSPADGSATATIGLPGDLSVELVMRFGSGFGGTFERRELVAGELESRSDGIFSFARSIYHAAGAESTDVTLPAGELTGRTYVMSDGGTPCRLQFLTHESGKCIQGKLVDEVRYDYIVNCNATSIITVRFGSGEFDRYHLNHTDLTFSRREIRGGSLVDTDSGTFIEIP